MNEGHQTAPMTASISSVSVALITDCLLTSWGVDRRQVGFSGGGGGIGSLWVIISLVVVVLGSSLSERLILLFGFAPLSPSSASPLLFTGLVVVGADLRGESIDFFLPEN